LIIQTAIHRNIMNDKTAILPKWLKYDIHNCPVDLIEIEYKVKGKFVDLYLDETTGKVYSLDNPLDSVGKVLDEETIFIYDTPKNIERGLLQRASTNVNEKKKKNKKKKK
jgi:hypothetical protein